MRRDTRHGCGVRVEVGTTAGFSPTLTTAGPCVPVVPHAAAASRKAGADKSGNSLTAALDQEDQSNDKQNTGDDLNHSSVIHNTTSCSLIGGKGRFI